MVWATAETASSLSGQNPEFDQIMDQFRPAKNTFISDDALLSLALQERRAAAQSSQAVARHLVEDVSQIEGGFQEFFRTATRDENGQEWHDRAWPVRMPPDLTGILIGKDKDRLWTTVESRNYFPLILSLGT